ncbi:uncharacterized protein LOC122664051 isoform X2 [Telopea speciosissima]|uniref:uncharacterized protein LOC122664051 isoform X2 n=1 Tax=Telopea speciosissima TaxID=54955 RepID=UPI001CC36A47|nr:uncharacterized protein LOC122664051 isoform X2 [Telopea speciosissima]
MMGFGSFGHGSSASSSNLSPLAQPFTVDRSLPKPNLNPLVPLGEDPYSYSYRPAFDNWLHLHPHTSLPDSFSSPNSYSESDSIHVPNLSRVSNHGHYGSQSITSFGTHMKPKTATSSVVSFPYDQQQSDSIRTTFVEAKPYYPQYPSAAIHDETSPVVLNESACDMLSVSNFAPLDENYHTGYTGSFSVGYMDQWSGFCDGLPDEEQGRRKGLDGNSFVSGNHGTVSITEKSFLKQGTLASEGLTAKSVDISAWKSSSGLRGTGWIDDRCSLLSEGTARVSPDFSRPGVLGPASMLQEAHFPEEPSPASDMKTWSSLFPDTASYERCFTQLDSCTTDPVVSYVPVTNSNPTLLFGARADGTNASALLTSPSRNVNFNQQPGDVFDNDESAGGITSNIKEPFIQTSSKGKEAYGHTCVGINDYVVVDSFPLKNNAPYKQKHLVVDSIELLKGNSEFQANHFKLSDSCNIVSGGAGTADFANRSSETFDQFNPAVDSPCWKGALSSHQSPFGVAVVMSPYLPVKDFECCNSSNLEGSRTLAVNADEAVAVSSQKEGGDLVPDEKAHGKDCLSSLSKGLSSVDNFPFVEDGLKDSVKAAPYHSKVNIESEILCSDGIQELTQPRKEHGPSIYSKRISELKPPHMKQISHWNNITSAELSTSEATVVNFGMDTKDPAQDGSSCVQFHAVEHASSLPFFAASVPVGLAKLVDGASDTETEYPVAKSNIWLLVNAMYNLSELLLSSCFRDVEALKEQDHEVLRHIINNLDACLSKKVGLMRPPMPQLQFPESSTSCLRKLTDPQKVSGTCRSQVNSVEAVNVLSQHGLEGKTHSTVSSKQGNKLEDFVSMEDETGIEIDNDMTQAIKKIMKEKLGNEETHPQTILFKNLWLEAEAALCSIKYKARYVRLKREMEKSNRDQEKGKSIDTGVHLNPEVSRDPRVDDMLIQKMESAGAVPDKVTQETPTGIDVQVEDIETSVTNKAEDIEASAVSKAEDIEASVMARFHILKCRVNSCSSMNKRHLLDSNGIGAHGGKVETMSSQCHSGIQNIKTKTQPIKVVDVGFSERRKPWPFIRNRSEDGSLEVTIRPDMQYDGTSCSEQIIGLDSDVPEQQDTMKEFGVCMYDELVNALISNRDGNQFPGGGFDSPSSDWEHVLNEELKWQN